ncbi:hypothetical protein [Streptomyces chartreusis]|uniref:hypothetical protein n=1 Tax=Streptomyces chartreusis TaxID=1969 RepID=UPI00381F34BA
MAEPEAEVGGSDDGESHADGADEYPGRHRRCPLVPGHGGLGILQVAEDLGDVRGEAGVMTDVDPGGFVAALGLKDRPELTRYAIRVGRIEP